MAQKQGEDISSQNKLKEKEQREEAFLDSIATSLGVKAKDKLRKSIYENEDFKDSISAFLHSDTPATACFVLPQSADTVALTTDTPHPDKFKRKGFVMLRMTDEPLTREDFGRQTVMLELTKGLMDQMYLLFNQVLAPIVQNPSNQVGWSDLVTKDLMERFNNYLAQLYSMIGLSKGKTLLPLPTKKVINSEGPEKDKAHIFEVSIVTWTKQIKNVLKLEPEQALKNGNHPGPHVEIEFWENKAANLNSIYQQLQSVEVKGILRFLQRSKSTYTNPFTKLQKEVQMARVQANDNALFLGTLKDTFQKFRDSQFQFTKLMQIFSPLMHNIFMIYKNSKFYKTPPRLLVLVRMICNAIITKAGDYVNGDMISALIGSGETLEACERLQNTIDICEKFKEAYFEYKAKSGGEWKLTFNALFVRLDQFIDRCHDILHLTSTILQFNKLERIELGGTKGGPLSETIRQIYEEFVVAVEAYKTLHYDTLNINLKNFDEDIFKFRNKIKDLERRLSSVIVQAFDDNDTVGGKFRLLDIFETILTRPLIEDELEKKHGVILDMYRSDLKLVQEVFLEGKRQIELNDSNNPIFMGMPPVAGTLAWCKGLLDRIDDPIERIPTLGQGVVQREEFKDIEKLHKSIVKAIKEHEQKVLEQWQKEVQAGTESKLQNFLLSKNEQGLLKVNFDPALVRLLREVKYMKQLKLDVIPMAEQMFVKSEVFRRQIVSLDLIVQNYNRIVTCLEPVEQPLVKARILTMDKQIEPGINLHRWKSTEIDAFIAKSKEVVDSLYDIVDKMKKSLDSIDNELKRMRKPFVDRKPKPISPEEYDNIERAVFTAKVGTVKECGTAIHKLLKEVSDAVKADRKSIEWRNYTQYINSIVFEGVVSAIVFALDNLNEQISRTSSLPPLFEIKLQLEGKEGIFYEPDVRETNDPKAKTVRDTIRGWMYEIVGVSFHFPRLDIVLMTTASGQPQTGDFTLEIKEDFQVRHSLSQITRNLNFIEKETDLLRNELVAKYSYLWVEDPAEGFNKFLGGYETKEEQAGEEEVSKENPLLKGCREQMPDLEVIDEKITQLKVIQGEVGRVRQVEDRHWLRIDLRGFVRTLEQKIAQWIRVYTQFLRTEYKTILSNTKEFITRTNDGIKVNPAEVMKDLDQVTLSEREKEKNRALLMKVMKHISEVKDVNDKFAAVSDRMRAMVTKLKKHGVQITEKGEEEPLQAIENVNNKYTETAKKVFEIKADILQLQTTESIEIKKKLDEFSKKVEAFRADYKANLPYAYEENMTMAEVLDSYKKIDLYYEKLRKYEHDAKEFASLEKLFELEHRQYKPLKECLQDLRFLKNLWDLISIVNYQYQDWKGKLWRQIKADVLIEQNKVFQTMVKLMSKEVKAFKGYINIQDKVANMNLVLASVDLLLSGAMEERHWKQLKERTHTDFDEKSPTFTFDDVLGLKLYKYSADVSEIVDVALKEGKIEKKLKAIEAAWSKLNFQFEPYKEMFIFAPIDNMMETLDMHSLDLMGMKAQGKYVEFFKDTVDSWREKLGRVYSVADEWLKVQKNWRILVNIFLGSEDIRMQLPEDTKIFEGVHQEFVDMMGAVHEDPLAIEACTDARKESLVEMSQKIKKCEKALNDYLEQKKKIFPRFYFLSNQSLLTILSNGQNPPKVAEFIGDCFDGLKTLKFVPGATPAEVTKKADGMYSKDDELIPFETPFVAEGQVELWLKALQYKMRQELYLVLANAKSTTDQWETGEKPRQEWVRDWCAQMSLLTTVIVWTEDVSRAFEELSGGNETAMKECSDMIVQRIKKLILKVTQPLEVLDRMKYINVITIDVHGRDVVQNFVNVKISEAESFAWQSQLKFEWTFDKNKETASRQHCRFHWESDTSKPKCVIRIVDWLRFYSYEYIGNSLRLVVTPLTDRCYITLTQALNLIMGGAPAGPAGTGKTETVKDLGRAVGLPVMVFNCSDQMNKDSMAQIFMGLAQSGAWGCFDEFNRISIEVLSVVSTQVKTCLDAQKEKKKKFVFIEEGEINLEDTAGFFITMNPGYAGRTELPQNLKALFRSCAMVVPDIILICENMLMSEGFVNAKELSKKFVSLYNLSKELLSKQRHYDWGLRAVKSVLRQAGGLRRADKEIAEDPLLMRALRDFNLPKIVTDDKPIFTRLITDLFPGAEAPMKQNPTQVRLCKEATVQHMGLCHEDNFTKKCIEMSEILDVRHCMFVIGPPGSGKTCVWKTLLKTNQLNGEEYEYDTLNPKAVTADELFGSYTKTKEWKNGVLATIMKSQTKCEQKYKPFHKHKWTILDGDVDPEWIESLNTVMDDNKVLTLVSNDRIPLSPSMRLLFEVSNLRNATPATVSRGGVLFINETDIGWVPYMNSWLERTQHYMRPSDTGANIKYPRLDENAKTVFIRCFQTYIDQPGDIHDPNKMVTIAPTQLMGLIHVITCILDGVLTEYMPTIEKMEADGKDEELKTAYEAFFIFATMWAFGGSIGGGQDDEALMKSFNGIWRSYAKIKFPDQNYCYDYFWSLEEMKWLSWNSKVTAYEAPQEINFNKIYVNTQQTTRMKYLLDIHLNRRKPILFVGGAGTGKTSLVRNYLATTKPEQVSYKTINFSSFTDSKSLQRQIESMLEKKSGKTYGSATNKILVAFIDDLNMPYVDKYGTQSPIQLLRQILDYGSIFNLEQLEERKYVQDLLFFSCLNHKSGSFTVDLRLQKNFSVFAQNTPSQDVIRTIFGSVLGQFLAAPGWENKVAAISDKLIESSIYIFQRILKNNQYSPSAKKFHYQFNFRELAKVVEGMMRAVPSMYRTPLQLQKLWHHETRRVFEDRFINEEDINVFRTYVREGLVKSFGEINEKESPLEDPVLFTTFIAEHKGQEPNYLVVNTIEELKEVLTEKLEEYNDSKAQMNLVLFFQAMEHICKICRIVTFMNGNALLVGVGGSGKQSLARLSIFINGYEFEQMLVTQQFGMNELRTYLSDMYRKIAKPNSNTRVYVLNDSQIKEEAFLIPINDMLNSGWISDLFTKEDFEALVNNLRNEAKSSGVADNAEALSGYFLEKMKKNLKVILCFSPVGDAMRVRSRKFPGIINSTSIDWFHPWPKNALIDVGSRFLEDTELEPDLIEKIALNMAETHVSIDKANEMFRKLERRNNYTTPKSFLELISFYKQLLTQKRTAIDNQIVRYQNGLQILDQTKSQVEGLQQELKVKMVEVERQKVQTDKLIEKVSYENAIAQEEQQKANIEEEKTNHKSEEAKKLEEVCSTALAKAIPALEKAKQAVNCLEKPAITEMKNLGKPPPGVVNTARVVMILLGEKVSFSEPDDKFWPKAQTTMNNPDRFLLRVKQFKGEEIDPAIIEGSNKIINDPTKNYTEKDMVKQSFAASKLCAWSINIVVFNRIFKEVLPLQNARNKASDQLREALKELARVKEQVRKLNQKVDGLRKGLAEAEQQKRIVEEDATNCMNKLSAAEKLVNGLSGENKRWSENVAFLSNNKRSIIGDVLLASQFVSYIGAFSAKLRNSLWRTIWLVDIVAKQIPTTEGIEPLKILTNEAVKAKWKIEGLPADTMSLENAAIISSCSRWPLLIDPQLQGSTWIKGANAERLSIISINQKNWMRELTRCISEGRAVLLEGIQEEIDATLEPLLTRAINKKGSWTIELGGDIVDYDKEFKLYLMTKMFNPHFRPEIAAQCTIINFIVTEGGLEEQLLASVVNVEKNELEVQKQQLVKMQNEFQVELDRLESELLTELSKADAATILDNKELIEKLDSTKKTAINIQKQSDEAKITEAKINTEREIYRPVAIEGAMLYFLIISLCIVDHMYQYSLESFSNFFFKAINKVEERDETRIGRLVESIRITIYQWVSRGLFERHKLIFLTLIMFRLMQKKTVDVNYTPEEMDFLVKGVPKPGYENNLDWLPNTAWDMVQALTVIEEFKSFAQNMEKDAPNRFKDWYNEISPEDVKLPLDWKRLDSLPFKKLLVIRCLRPDRITVSLTRFIRETLPKGDDFVDMDSKLSFVEVLGGSIEDSDPSIPIFFILSPGADPVKEVEKIIKKSRDKYRIEPGKSFFNIALGQGQDQIARRRIEEGNKEGHWIMLQNIHLMPRWLIELEKILDAFKGEANSHPNFRLLLSAEPSDGVPIGILDRSIKLTNEPPSGLKPNMKRAFTFFPKEEVDQRDNKVKSILFGLCFFHSTVIERRRFGAKGWNMSYPFNMGDLRDSYLVLNRYMETASTSGKVPFQDIIYIFGEIMYGGHIVDDWDRRLCRAYLENVMTAQIFEEEELFPFIQGKNLSFRVPPPTTHEKYIEHIDQLSVETPLAYGLHPNAEIGFRTNQCNSLFNTLVQIQPKDASAAEGSGIKSNQQILQELIKRFVEDLNLKGLIFNVDEIKNKIDAEQKGPYQNVFIQEIEYMTILLIEIVKSLEEIDQGLKGNLTISEKMEQTMDALVLNRVPTSWNALGYPSKRGLESWVINLVKRIEQLDLFKNEPLNLPKVIMISRFFNPQSYLTAIKQVVAANQKGQGLELNKLYIQTDITKKTIEEIDVVPKDGAYVFGFILEGARWDPGMGMLDESKPKEMFSVIPVVFCRAAVIPAEGKEDKSLYQCPAYKTEDRGSTYVFTAQLKTKVSPRKWILAGVAIIMDVEGVSDESTAKKKEEKK